MATSAKESQQPLAQEYTNPIPRHTEEVRTVSNFDRQIVLAVLGIIAMWSLLSFMTSQLVFFAKPICSSRIPSALFCSRGTPFIDRSEVFNWPDGDVILRSTHDTESRDFRTHKLFLSFASPVFKDILAVPQCAPPAICLVDLDDPPRALELILRLIYPSSVPPVLDDLAVVLEAFNIANAYKIEVAQSRLQSSLVEFAKTEPLRVYAIACRLGLENEMKIASKHTLPINLLELTQLPEEFKLIPATEYHRLIRLHTRYRKEAMTITAKSMPNIFDIFVGAFGVIRRVGSSAGERDRGAEIVGPATTKPIVDTIMKGTPLDYWSLALALETDYAIDVEAEGVGNFIHSILDKTNALNLTV